MLRKVSELTLGLAGTYSRTSGWLRRLGLVFPGATGFGGRTGSLVGFFMVSSTPLYSQLGLASIMLKMQHSLGFLTGEIMVVATEDMEAGHSTGLTVWGNLVWLQMELIAETGIIGVSRGKAMLSRCI